MPLKDPIARAAYHKQYMVGWTQRNAAKHGAFTRAANDKWKLRIYKQLDSLKTAPCLDCGNTFPPECMDFDHVRGEKLGNVSTLVALHQPEAVIFAEVAKCEIVCSNCHRIRTKRRRVAG